MFSTLYGTYFSFQMHFKMSSAICFNLDHSKIFSSGNGLIHGREINLRHKFKNARSHCLLFSLYHSKMNVFNGMLKSVCLSVHHVSMCQFVYKTRVILCR